MDSPDMDDLLDSLEEDLPTTKNETSKSLKSPLKNIDDSAINNARQKSSQFDENNKSLNNSFMVKSGNEMNGMDEVLNALEDNKTTMNAVKENVKEELNNSNIESKTVENADFPEISMPDVLTISPAFVESEFTQTKEDAEVAAILNSITEKASLEFTVMDKVANGFPENIEKILNDSTFEETIDINVSESLTFPIIGETIDVNIPFSNTLKEEFSTKEVPFPPSNVMLEESTSNNSSKAISDDFKIHELSTSLTTENPSNANISKLEVEEDVVKEEDIVSKDVTITQLNEVSEEVERILNDETIEIESLNIVIPELLPQNEKEEEPEMHEIMEKMEECIQTLTKDELIVEGKDFEDQINFEKAKDKMDLKEDNSMEPQPEAGDAKPASEAIESERSEHVSTVISSLQTERKPSEPIGFDMSQDINEELNEELLQELDQMAEEQIKEGTIEAAAVVAAEARNSEPQLEPARSYIPETPLINPNTVILSTHDLSVVNSNPPLTESELQLGKTKPYWIPDQDCVNCMLCSSRFTVINRRHHCRCCGRVLCSSCCNLKKALPYIEDPEKKQKVCEPCSKTLDKIEDYEFLQAEIQKRQTQRRQLISESEGADNEGGVEEVPSSANPTVVSRKKSVLKSKNSERPETEQKRTVKFLDGVRPGHDNMDSPGPSGSVVASSSSASAGTVTETQTDELKATKKKVPKGVHRRNRERRVQEEQISLVREDHLFIVDCDAQMTKLSMDKVLKKLIDGEKVMVAIKRNLWVVIQLVNYRNSKVWFFSSQGMATIGSDELCIAFEAQEFDFEIIKEVIQFFTDERKRVEENKGNNSDSTENSEVSITDNLSPPRSLFITSLLYLFDHFFLDSLIPSNESLDEKVKLMGSKRLQ
uniref:FYVE-type domain-containing protein n=1 Tax=Panagrolaimus davidi TaxID=227884 RepID=A0A914QFM6_9BILA